MTAQASTTHEDPHAPSNSANRANSRHRRRTWSRLRAGVFWMAVVGLLGLNAWWFLRDLRPAPDLRAIHALIQKKQYSDAEAALRELHRRSPEDGAVLMALGRVLAAQNRLAESGDVLLSVPKWWPTRGEALFLAGEAFNQAGLARKAEQAWSECAAFDPLHPTAEMFYLTAIESLIEIYAMQERWDEARVIAWSCIDRVAPDQRLNVIFMLLRTRVQRVVAEARIPKLKRFVAADPNDIESRLALARAEASIGNAEEAGRLLDFAMEQEPNNVKAWRDQLAALNERGDTQGLAAAIAKLPESTKNDGQIWKFRGLAARTAGDLENAVVCFEHAVELRPFDEEAHYQLALALQQNRRRPEAEKSFARYNELKNARTKILPAYEAFSQAHGEQIPDSAKIAETTKDLAAICRTLGWPRLASELDATVK
jgi:Flp pilus assembly protein TadD